MFLQKRKKLKSWRKSEEKAGKVIGSKWFAQITRRNWPNHSQRQRHKLDWIPESDWGRLSKWLAQVTRRNCPSHLDCRGGKRAENPNSKKRSPNPLQTPQDQSQEPRPSLREFHSQSNTKSKEESKTTKKTKSNWDYKTLIKLDLRLSSYKRAASKAPQDLFSASAILRNSPATQQKLSFFLFFFISVF